MQFQARHAAGLTLMEALLASVILAVAALAVAQMLTSGHAQLSALEKDRRAQWLAEALLEEVLSVPCTADGASTMRGKTTLASFHNFSQAAGAITDSSGTAYPQEYQTFSRLVAVGAGTTFTLPGTATAATGYTVTVTVTDGSQSWTLTRFVPLP